MPKLKTKWICQNCGYETPKSLGKCPECAGWNTFVEEVYDAAKPQAASGLPSAFQDTAPCLINEITIENTIRFSSGIEEFDRVLGGGLVQGSIVLLPETPV